LPNEWFLHANEKFGTTARELAAREKGNSVAIVRLARLVAGHEYP
jgi:hypothetical protein